jgi:hypothetical protein
MSSTGRAVVGGLVGTAALTVVLLWGPAIGSPSLNLPLWDGTFFTLNLGLAVLIGYICHFGIGVGLALVYQRHWLSGFRGEGWLKGALYGAVVWAALVLVGLPLFDWLDPLVANGLLPAPGFLALALGPAAPIMLLIAHLVYGALVGALVPTQRPGWRAASAL